MNNLELRGIAPKIEFIPLDDGSVIVYITHEKKIVGFTLTESQAIDVYSFFKEWMERDTE